MSLQLEKSDFYRRDKLGRFTHEPVKTPNLEPSFNLGYIVGAVKGDGCIVKRERHSCRDYGLKLSVTSESFADSFVYAVANIGLHAARWESRPYSAWATAKKLYNVQANSVRLIQWYQSLNQDSLGTLLSFLSFRRGFLRGFFDADGSHGCYGKRMQERVSFSNTSLELMEAVNLSLSLEGFSQTIRVNKERFGKTEYRINLYNGKARALLEKLNPIDGLKEVKDG